MQKNGKTDNQIYYWDLILSRIVCLLDVATSVNISKYEVRYALKRRYTQALLDYFT